MHRRTLLKRAALLGALAPASGAGPLFEQPELRPPASTGDRLDQGPFDVDQDQGWLTVLFTTPSETPQRNPGLGLVGYSGKKAVRRLPHEPAGKRSSVMSKTFRVCRSSTFSTYDATGGTCSHSPGHSIFIPSGI
jgi:hypothetical protein